MDYTPDHAAQEAKRRELIATAAETLGNSSRALARRVVDAFCEFTPPLMPCLTEPVEPPSVFLITARSGGSRGGRTRKPGNLRLNWRKLLGEFGDISLTVTGVVAAPLLIPLAALSIWNKLWSHAAIPLSREHATALVAMWHRRDENHRIHRTKAHQEINTLFIVFTWPPIDAATFALLLDELVALHCIEIKDNDLIWLRESVETTYD